MQSQRDEELLRKHLEENQGLKKQVKRLESNPSSQLPSTRVSSVPSLKSVKQGAAAGNSKHVKKESASQIEGVIMDDVNEKFISNLAT